MFFKLAPLCMTLLIISNAEAHFTTINRNLSGDRGNAEFERDYEYPMYQEVAPVPCDLTTACDAFCCQDPDCKEYEISQCSQPGDKCSGLLSFLDCSCYNSDKPEWLSAFCYIYKNPVYLGKFFETPKKIEKFSTLRNAIGKNSLFYHNQNKGEHNKAKPQNLLGSPIMTFAPLSDSFPSVNPLLRKKSLKDSTYACTSGPVRYRLNGTATCLTKITREICQHGHTLGALSYLVQSDNSSGHNDVPVVLKNSDFLEGLKIDVIFTCVELKLKVAEIKKKKLNFFHEGNTSLCPVSSSAFHTILVNDTCLNVLVNVQYQFIVNGSDIVKLIVEYGLANISVPAEEKTHKYIYFKQKFSANFFDIMHKSYANRSQSQYEDIYNRGYFIGEELNFGYRLMKNSSASWQKGILGVFGQGDSCENLSPITFGFHFFSVCYIRQRFPNCTQLRNAIEETFEALLQGDSLAAYANLRPPYNNTVPLLRNFPAASGESLANITQCRVPAVQKILVQYTSFFTENGDLIHRAIGVRVDRMLQNVNVTDAEVRLTAQALFFYVSSSREKPMSRFWTKMLSRELSDNSWLKIFNAFEDVNSVELEEITFWCAVLTLCAAAAFVFLCTKADVRLDYFL